MKKTTRVLFVWFDTEYEGYRRGDSTQSKTIKTLIALFPDNVQGKNEIGSYEHIGQHGAASRDLLDECKDAEESEYKDLKEELEGLGYDLEVLNPKKNEQGIELITNKDYCVNLWRNNKVDTIQGIIDEPEIEDIYYFWTEEAAKEYAEILARSYDEGWFVEVGKNTNTLEDPFYETILTIQGGTK